MKLLKIEICVGAEWQRVRRLQGATTYDPPERGSWDDDLTQGLEGFLADHAGRAVWVETDEEPDGVLFGPGAVGPFRLRPVK
ncbi:hypothetical protein ACIA8H_23265 [Streptomyces goshikiensis]|uniref:hypothetical protein n=1 Tax=Streptomyces goshikiensis TaxID=1942 RepID=UPI00379D0A09